MLRTVVRLTPCFSIPIFSHERNEYDHDVLNTPLSDGPKTGLERVKEMYSRNELGEISVELHTVIQSSSAAAFIGAALGGFFKSRIAYINFIENNQATIFTTTREAQKKLQDYVTVAFAKGAYHWGWRLGIFMFIFSTITTTVSVYRGDTSLVDYVLAGSLAGALYKANLGMAAMLVGAGVGGVFSLIGGSAILGLLKVTGISIGDIRKAMYSIKEARVDQMKQAEFKASDICQDPLAKHHDAIIKEKGVKKLEELIPDKLDVELTYRRVKRIKMPKRMRKVKILEHLKKVPEIKR